MEIPWENGRRLDNPAEWKDVKDMFFAIDVESDMTNIELLEIESQRKRKTINQAR